MLVYDDYLDVLREKILDFLHDGWGNQGPTQRFTVCLSHIDEFLKFNHLTNKLRFNDEIAYYNPQFIICDAGTIKEVVRAFKVQIDL